MKASIIGILIIVSLQSVTAQSVGIGTNSPSPSAQLDVSSISRGLLIPRMTTVQRNAIASPANGLMVYDTNLSAFYFYNGKAWAAVNSGGGGSDNWGASGNNIYNSNSGNVGIGTSTGLKEKLSVKGNLFVTHTNPNDLSNGGNKAVLNLHGANAGLGIVNFLKPDTSIAASITYANIFSQFFLQNGNNLYQLFLRNNGNVGIGTNNPSEKLDINGNIRIREDILADGKVLADGIVSGSGLQTPGNLQVGGVGLMNGNFSTNGNLSVGGSSTLTGNVSTEGDIFVKNTAATIQLRDGSNINKGFVQLSGNDVRFGTNSGNNLGNVIVRMNGNNRFQFAESGRFTLFAENTPTMYFNTSGLNKAFLQLQGDNLRINAPNNRLYLGNDMTVDDATGRVGIGTVSPTQKLHVVGNAFVTGNLNINGTITTNDLSVENNITADGSADFGILTVSGGSLGTYGSFAIGLNSYAAGFNSGAIGENVRVLGGDNSYAIGTNIRNAGDGTVIIKDGSVPTGGFDYVNTDNFMFMRFLNGYRFVTETGAGVELNKGDNSWSTISDSTKKENFLEADGNTFLKRIAGMQLGSWNYKVQDKQKRHYGPMAQEFHANFGNDGIGRIGNDTTIASADIDGVMMIALQALEKKTSDQQQTIERLKTDIQELKAVLTEQRVFLEGLKFK